MRVKTLKKRRMHQRENINCSHYARINSARQRVLGQDTMTMNAGGCEAGVKAVCT